MSGSIWESLRQLTEKFTQPNPDIPRFFGRQLTMGELYQTYPLELSTISRFIEALIQHQDPEREQTLEKLLEEVFELYYPGQIFASKEAKLQAAVAIVQTPSDLDSQTRVLVELSGREIATLLYSSADFLEALTQASHLYSETISQLLPATEQLAAQAYDLGLPIHVMECNDFFEEIEFRLDKA